MKLTKKILLLSCLVFIVSVVYRQNKNNNQVSTVRAYGDLTVTYLGVPLGASIFNIVNIAPGYADTKTITVHNGGVTTKMLSYKVIKTGPVGQISPLLETSLELNGKKLSQLFSDSSGDGIILEFINPGQTKNYPFEVLFPASAGNEYKNKSVVFDIAFGTVSSNHILISEVYYGVENTKKNPPAGGGKVQWIELYNPTNTDISLKNWSLEDATGTGKKTKINPNKTIKAHGFALLSKDASVWQSADWRRSEDRNAQKIELGNWIGNDLDLADKLILKDPTGNETDFVAWGGAVSGWNLSAVNKQTIARISPEYDSDSPSDWKVSNPATPGY